MNTSPAPNLKQDGIAMIIALLFLLITTLLGVSTLQANLFGEKMTLSAIQREKALEAAEGALLEGEAFVEDFKAQITEQVVTMGVDDSGDPARVPTTAAESCQASINGRGGICAPVESSSTYSAASLDNWIELTDSSLGTLNVWSTTNRHREASDALTNKYKLASPPRYMIEFMGFTRNGDGSSGCDEVSPGVANPLADELNTWPYCSQDRYLFRITALATTGNYDETRVMLQSTYVVEP